MVHIERIETRAPFGRALYIYFGLYDIHINELPAKTRVERNYLAWEIVRRKTNPYFAEGTGFEGYLVGTCQTPPDALEAIIKVNQNILDAIARLYRFQIGLQSRLMKTLTGELADYESIHIWSAYLGAELGRLRTHIPRNKAAILFQNQTYAIVAILPPITYRSLNNRVVQNYGIGYMDNPVMVIAPNLAKLDIKGKMLNPSQQTPWLVASNIGRFGHPLVRSFLDKVW